MFQRFTRLPARRHATWARATAAFDGQPLLCQAPYRRPALTPSKRAKNPVRTSYAQGSRSDGKYRISRRYRGCSYLCDRCSVQSVQSSFLPALNQNTSFSPTA